MYLYPLGLDNLTRALFGTDLGYTCINGYSQIIPTFFLQVIEMAVESE
jgi:hypothetical protein